MADAGPAAPSAPAAQPSSTPKEAAVQVTKKPQLGGQTQPKPNGQGGAANDNMESAANTNKEVAPPRKHKIKIDGQEEEWDDDTLARKVSDARKHETAERRMAKVAEIEKRAAEHERLLVEAGYDPKQNTWDEERLIRRSEEAILKRIQQQQMSPEQRRIQQLEAQMQAREEADRQSQSQFQEQQLHEESRRAGAELESRMAAALQSQGIKVDGSDPRSLHAIARMAVLARASLASGYEVSPEEMAQVVAEDMDGGIVARTTGPDGQPLTGDALLDRLERASPGLVKRINEAAVARHLAGTAGRPPAGIRPSAPRGINGQFKEPARAVDKYAWRDLRNK